VIHKKVYGPVQSVDRQLQGHRDIVTSISCHMMTRLGYRCRRRHRDIDCDTVVGINVGNPP